MPSAPQNHQSVYQGLSLFFDNGDINIILMKIQIQGIGETVQEVCTTSPTKRENRR